MKLIHRNHTTKQQNGVKNGKKHQQFILKTQIKTNVFSLNKIIE